MFNFQSLLLVILLLICTSTYVHAIFPALLDNRKEGYVLRLSPLRKEILGPAIQRIEADMTHTTGSWAYSGSLQEWANG